MVAAAARRGPVDDRWASAGPDAESAKLRANATTQRAVLDALRSGPVRVAELAADLGSVDSALRALERVGAVAIERRRRMREALAAERPAPRHERLSAGQQEAIRAISDAISGGGDVVLLDGVTGSGKTEVYLRAIEQVIERWRQRMRARAGDLAHATDRRPLPLEVRR